MFTGSSSSTIFENTIVSDPVEGTNCDVFRGDHTTNGYNLEGPAGDGSCGFGAGAGDQVNVDPLLGALADYDGPTETHALPLASPAVDQGTSETTADTTRGLLALDQRAFIRRNDDRRLGPGRSDHGHPRPRRDRRHSGRRRDPRQGRARCDLRARRRGPRRRRRRTRRAARQRGRRRAARQPGRCRGGRGRGRFKGSSTGTVTTEAEVTEIFPAASPAGSTRWPSRARWTGRRGEHRLSSPWTRSSTE